MPSVTSLLLMLTLLAGCGGSSREPVEPTADPKPAPAEDVDPPAAPDGALTLSDQQVPVGGTFTVSFDRPGRNGCYRQTEVATTMEDQAITHAYATTYEGDICTQALVPGGFATTVTLPTAGRWQGRVLVDGVEVATYSVEAVPS